MKATPELTTINLQNHEEVPTTLAEPLINNPQDGTSSVTVTDKSESPRTWKEKIKTFFIYARPMLTMLVIDVGIPLAIYYVLKIWVSILIALVLSGIPPLLHTIYTFIRRRRIDILGCVFVLAYVISAILTLITGNARLSLLRDSTITAVIGFLFLITLIPLRTRWFTVRPLAFLISQQTFANLPPTTWVDREGFEHSMPTTDFNWEHIRIYRRYFYVLTGLWAILLLGEFIAKVIMIESTLSLDNVILYGNIILLSIMVVMVSFTFVGIVFLRRRVIAFSRDWMKINDYRVMLPQ